MGELQEKIKKLVTGIEGNLDGAKYKMDGYSISVSPSGELEGLTANIVEKE